MKKIVIRYENSKKEISEREISQVSPQVSQNGHKLIYAYCHLRETVRSFILDSILEIKVDGETVDKEQFWKDNIIDKDKFAKDLDKILKKKKKEFDEYVNFIESTVKLVLED